VIRIAVFSFFALLVLAALSQIYGSFGHWISDHHLGRALVKRLTDAIFGPGQSKPATDDNSHH
jgi:hypothetical protein